MRDTTWAIMPVLAGPQMTEDALSDLLAGPELTKILIVNQGVDADFRLRLEKIAEEYEDQILLWNHVPPLPSLSATWNRALRFVWETGGTQALVVNNDVRLNRATIEILSMPIKYRGALFVSAVGVTPEQFDPSIKYHGFVGDRTDEGTIVAEPEEKSIEIDQRGGPDFSCFLISKAGHEKYPFDEAYIPAYGEDIDMHRRYLLGGDGERIFSINLPFQHERSGTLRNLSDAQRTALERRLGASREYHALKWGGQPGAERFTIPFTPESAQDGVTTSDLQAKVLAPQE